MSDDGHDRAEVEEAFRRYFLTGIAGEDWIAWSQLFTDDAVYHDHFWGTFHGPSEIQRFLEGTMSFASHVYSVLVWYVIDGDRIVYEVRNRADHLEPGEPPIEFPSLQVIEYAGGGRWSSEEDWWTVQDMKRFNQRYAAACQAHGPEHEPRLSRLDWGPWVDWARPAPGDRPTPSWYGRDDVTPITRLSDMTFGARAS
ncbi:MAG TPA: nuclear transport factor 2 family protein [Acidimicrobiales bacterium]|nr:nuclear transport factor 2 family protein [Acidimicrobiales bacterium]